MQAEDSRLNVQLNVDEKIINVVRRRKNLVVQGPRLCGRTFTVSRLKGSKNKEVSDLFEAYETIDLPFRSWEEDYKWLKDGVRKAREEKRHRLAVFLPDYYSKFFEERHKREEKGQSLFEDLHMEKIAHVLEKKEAEEMFRQLLGNEALEKNLENQWIKSTIISKSRDSEGETYLPALLSMHAKRLNENHELVAAMVGKSQTTDQKLAEEYLAKVSNRLEQEEKTIKEWEKRRECIYNALGLEASWTAASVFSLLKEHSGGVFDVLKNIGVPGMVASFVPGVVASVAAVAGWAPLAVMGVGLIFSLRERAKEEKKPLAFLAQAKDQYRVMDPVERELLAYDFERSNKLGPGTGLSLLDGLFEKTSIEDLNNSIDRYFSDNPRAWDTIESSAPWKALEDKLRERGIDIANLSSKYDAFLLKINRDIEKIRLEIAIIQRKLEQIDGEIKAIREDLYAMGAKRINTEHHLTENLKGLAVGEKESLVGIEDSREDVFVKNFLEHVIEEAAHKLVVLNGEPGAGKTTLLYMIGKKLLGEGRELFYINDVGLFSPDSFQRLGENSYAVMDLTSQQNAQKFFDRILSLEGRVSLSRVIVAVRTGFIHKVGSSQEVVVERVAHDSAVLNEMARRKLLESRVLSKAPFRLTDEQIEVAAASLVERANGLSIYVSEAAKLLSSRIEEGRTFDRKLLDELPTGISEMILEILRAEGKRNGGLLIHYYLVSHYPYFPRELLRDLESLYGIGQPFFLNESIDGSVSLHSWYKEVTDRIFTGETIATGVSNSDSDKASQVAEIAEEVRSSVDLAEKLKKNYLDAIAMVVNSNQQNPAMKILGNHVSEFKEHLGSSVNLKDLADAMMLCAMIHLIDRKLRRSSGGGYGFNILKERVSYSSLDPAIVPFYHTIVGFIVNGFVNEEVISVGREQSRPFYSISTLLFSRVLGGSFAEDVSKEFFEDSPHRLDLPYLYSSKSRAPYVSRQFIAAVATVLEGLDYLQVVSDFEKAQLLYCKGLLQEALKEFDNAIRLNPKNPEYHRRKGGVLHDLGRFSDAVKEFDEAISLDPNNSIHHSSKAGALLRMGNNFSEALKEFDNAISFDRNNPIYHSIKGFALGDMGRYPEALLEFQEAIDCKPDDPVYHSNKGVTLDSMERFPEALEEFDAAIKIKQDNPVFHDKKGKVLLRMKHWPEALKEFEKAISSNPTNSDYHTHKGGALDGMERFPEALREFDEAIAMKPDDADYHNSKGNVLLRMELFPEALKEFDKAISLDPDNSNYHGNRRNALRSLENLSRVPRAN